MPYLELFAYGCFTAAGLLAGGYPLWCYWKFEHG